MKGSRCNTFMKQNLYYLSDSASKHKIQLNNIFFHFNKAVTIATSYFKVTTVHIMYTRGDKEFEN